MDKRKLLLVLHIVCFTASAQIKQQLDLSSEIATGNGSYTAHYLSANRHGILSSHPNTGYIRASYTAKKEVGNYILSGGADLQLTAQQQENYPFFIQQLYLQAQWKWINLCVGSKEIAPLLRDTDLSSGSLVWSGNTRPIPGIYIGTNDYVYLLGTNKWIQFYLDFSYGYYTDTDYTNETYNLYLKGKTGYGRSFKTTNVWSHQKRIALRTRTDRPFVITLSCEHAVQFGGKSINYLDTTLNGNFSPRIKDFFTVLLPLHGDATASSGDQAFVYGNHIGNISGLFEYQWGKGYTKKVGFYLENPFEDGSGIRKGNRFDGLWGIEYHNHSGHNLINNVVLEYLQTTDQSGPIHWAPGDFAGQAIANIAHDARGADNYYNNYFYNGYSNYGQACGSPMIKSPAYNDDHYLCFTDNRVLAWHLGINGTLWTKSNNNDGELNYRILASHRRSWGTYFEPAPSIRVATSGMTELSYKHGRWQESIAYAFDEGDLVDHNHSIDLRIIYHFAF